MAAEDSPSPTRPGKKGPLTFHGCNVTMCPGDSGETSESPDWSLFLRCRGPRDLCVATILVESYDRQACQMPKDEALIESMRFFAEQQDYVGFSMGPGVVNIYESWSREELVNARVRSPDWHTHVRQLGLKDGRHPKESRLEAPRSGPLRQQRGKALPQNCSAHVATLHWEVGYIDYEDPAFLATLRKLCASKGFTAFTVAARIGELNPLGSERKHSSRDEHFEDGLLDASASWVPREDTDASACWTELDLGKARLVHGLVTQGANYTGGCVTEVEVDCGLEAGRLQPVADVGGVVARLPANDPKAPSQSRAIINFPSGPILARYVRIKPTKWHECVRLRVGVQVGKGQEVRFYQSGNGEQILDWSVEDADSTLHLPTPLCISNDVAPAF